MAFAWCISLRRWLLFFCDELMFRPERSWPFHILLKLDFWHARHSAREAAMHADCYALLDCTATQCWQLLFNLSSSIASSSACGNTYHSSCYIVCSTCLLCMSRVRKRQIPHVAWFYIFLVSSLCLGDCIDMHRYLSFCISSRLIFFVTTERANSEVGEF